MTTETASKPVVNNGYEDDDDDEKPLVFKRSSTVASTSNQSKSNPPRSKAVPSTKVPPMKPPLSSPNGSTPSNKASTVKSSTPSCSSKASPAKSPLRNTTTPTNKDMNQSECKKECEDAEDNKPLSFILSGNSSRPNKGSTTSRQVSSPQLENSNNGERPNRIIKDESDDEIPISSMLQKKIGSGMSGGKQASNDEKKPLAKNLHQNGSALKNEMPNNKVLGKRPVEKNSSADQSSLKKLKVSASPSSLKMKQDSAKTELDDKRKVLVSPKTVKAKQLSTREDGTDDDDVPISKRFKSESSSSKTSAAKPNVAKVNSSSSAAKPKVAKVNSSSSTAKPKVAKVNSSSSAVKPKVAKVNSSSSTAKPKVAKVDSSSSAAKPKVAKVSSSSSAAKPKVAKVNSSSSAAKPRARKIVSPPSRTMTKNSKKVTKDSKYSTSSKSLPSSGDGQKKWTTLVHNGVIFPPPYKSHGIKILYKGKPVDLTIEQEEVATMFAVMKETDYYNKPQFRENFWNDWRALLGRKHVIQKLEDCDFTPIYEWHLVEKEKKKQMTTEEKKAVKEEKLKLEEKYMWAVVDGVKEKVGNFRVEPPGLFRGRGEHPKMGKLKKRIHPCDITLNIGKGAPIPECPIPGERWKEVKHDNTVTWLAFWNDPINPKEFKYVFLAASSSLKGQSDKEKYEKARNLTHHIDDIRATYTKNFTAKDVTKRQIAVATYLIDKLALRAGNEKDDDEADTVGCCTLKVGNVECIPPNKIKFDFLGKDSIQYVNTVEVEPPVYKAIGQFQAGKSKTDDLFDELDTTKLNTHLKELVPGLTAKVFRTFNASFTLDKMLSEETRDGGDINQNLVVYQQANKQVAIICNHQRTVSKTHGAQIEKLAGKLEELRAGLKELKTNLDRAKKGKPPLEGSDGKKIRNLDPMAWEKKIVQQNVKIEKMERDMHTKEDLKTVALGTSKINYLDPRITVAWCKRHEVPIEKIFTKTLLEKFAWAMDAEPDFRFSLLPEV